MHEGQRRVVIENVTPEIDGGRFAAKRTQGEVCTVEADVFVDGHDRLAARLLHRRPDEATWREVEMVPIGNDRWRGELPCTARGPTIYTVTAWTDRYETWRSGVLKKVAAGQPVALELLAGRALLEEAAPHADGADRRLLEDRARLLWDEAALDTILDDELSRAMARHLPRRFQTTYARELTLVVDRERARFSTWYELFPRSASPTPERHGTFEDVIARLPYVAEMGFDVLYLPPIHPIGHTHRKGRNNQASAEPGDVGSPWAIGSEHGGHEAVHPELGTIERFDRLVAAARAHAIEIALDIAFQCSPDHPWVREHPEWFVRRADGSIQYAENPPKKYQDVFPLDFETGDWAQLWEALRDVFLHWVAHGVKIFRVDNPHTKPFPFWEWVVAEVKARDPDVLFLAEAFTRPKAMLRLAKAGFTQSYQYFPWKTSKHDLEEFYRFTTQTAVNEFFRSSSWPNTPDILTEYLQYGGRPAFVSRILLASTLSASYGIYGPAFELCVSRARAPGSEEYLDSEKYQLASWDLDAPSSLRPLIARLNRIRRDNPALQQDRTLAFHPTTNDQIICYTKSSPDGENLILVVVNLDPHHTQSALIDLPLESLGIDPARSYQVHDLIGDARFLWQGSRNFVELDPERMPGHIFEVYRHARTERDFEYFF